jgi:hypothetical protein
MNHIRQRVKVGSPKYPERFSARLVLLCPKRPDASPLPAFQPQRPDELALRAGLVIRQPFEGALAG